MQSTVSRMRLWKYPHNIDEDPDPDLDPACYSDADSVTLMWVRIRIWILPFPFDADPDLDSSFQIKAYNLEKVLKMAHIPYILACHLQIDADPDSVPAYHFDANADPNPDPTFQYDADPDPQHWIMELLILKNCTNNKQRREISQFIRKRDKILNNHLLTHIRDKIIND